MYSWTFEWTCGGWNQVSAETLEEAIEKASEMGRLPRTSLVPKLGTFKVSGSRGAAKIVNRWAGACD